MFKQGSNGLVKTGMYAWSRNPWYLAETLILIPAFAIMFDSMFVLMLGGQLNSFMVSTIIVPVEEKALLAQINALRDQV